MPGMEQMQARVDLQEPFEAEDIHTHPEQLEALNVEEPRNPADAERFASYRKQAHVDVLFPHDQTLTEELILATEMALGDIEMQPLESVEALTSVQAGVPEGGSPLGASTQNRSGLIDQGLVESDTGTKGSLLLTAEMGTVPLNIKQALQGVGQKAPVLPMANREGLRGFDYSTLGTIASSDDFNLNVAYAPRISGNGYIFRLELAQKPGVKFKRIVQNVFFLIDRSHSIRHQRYELTKQAVITLLSLLHAGDTFNILVFDDKIMRLSNRNMPVTPANIVQAREFLLRQEHGGLFAATDLYSSLGNIVPAIVAENEVNTAILFSDGDTFLSSDKQRDSIAQWTRQNAGKVSLYSVASGKGNNLALLDVLSVLNKGSVYYSVTDKGLESELLKLMQGIRSPIGKEIVITTIASAPGVAIKTYPYKSLLPNLYEGTPYVVYGTIDTLKDFHVFFQGKYYDKTLDIKQTVSFAKATRGDAAASERDLALQMAYEGYDRFLKEGHPAYLMQVKQLLQPYKIPVAFQ